LDAYHDKLKIYKSKIETILDFVEDKKKKILNTIFFFNKFETTLAGVPKNY